MSSDFISARCDIDRKEAYQEMARKLGYSNFSEFLLVVLDSLEGRFLDEAWECHLLHVHEDKIVAAEAHEVGGVPMATSAFRIVAPERFWAHVKLHTTE